KTNHPSKPKNRNLRSRRAPARPISSIRRAAKRVSSGQKFAGSPCLSEEMRRRLAWNQGKGMYVHVASIAAPLKFNKGDLPAHRKKMAPIRAIFLDLFS